VSPIVAEESVVPAVPAERRGRIHVVPRDRRRDGSWPPVAAEAVVAALESAGPEAIVLVRPPAADPGAAPLAALAELMEREVVRLPSEAEAAAWVVGIAVADHEEPVPPLRALQALAGAAGIAGRLGAVAGEGDLRLPGLRPAVLARWARCGWRACGRCRGGGLPGARCGRCGAPVGGAEA
jgi:hypothetical protein